MEPINSLKSRINNDKILSLNVNNIDKPSCFKNKLGVDENFNFTEPMEQCATPGSTCSGITSLLPQMKNLKIESSSDEAPRLYHPFGKVEKVITTMGLALIQSTCATVLLDIDTPVFIVLPTSSSEDETNPEYIPLGEIDDVFGSIGNPMYSVRLSHEIQENSISMTNSFVYLSSSHPDTNVLRVESAGNNKYCVVAEENGFCHE